MKFYGLVGFWEGDVEASPGIWKPNIEERLYFGEVLQNRRGFRSTDHQNGDLTVNNRISILSDLYAQQNWASIKYVNWNGTKWHVNSIEVNYPRLILEIGGMYNENDGRS